MLFQIIRGANIYDLIAYVFAMAFVVFCTLPIHECAHALVAYKLGDSTAKNMGRLTINPVAHIDWIGALMILIVGFGYAKPVPVNARNFKNPKLGMALSALAGPLSNILMAQIFLFGLQAVNHFCDPASILWGAVYSFLYFAALVNISLAVFNLIPIPPLDGSRILSAVLPDKYYFKLMQYERYIVIVVFVLLLTGVLSTPLSWLSGLLLKAMNYIAALPFGGLLK
ncbi:MAG: site-2 protease family protein [Ruminococcaceae bacterium]|jgi:Zn-dependent protease|nr:site-2 protease family protein [Oscillospiraceae bacterium]